MMTNSDRELASDFVLALSDLDDIDVVTDAITASRERTEKKLGGLRNPPRGRPPLPKDERRVKVSITLDAATVAYIKTQRQRENEPISQVIERLLLNSAA